MNEAIQEERLNTKAITKKIVENIANSEKIGKTNKDYLLLFYRKVQSAITRNGKPRKQGTILKLVGDSYYLAQFIEPIQFKEINESEEVFDQIAEKIREYENWNNNSKAQRMKSLLAILKTIFPSNPEWLVKKRLGMVGFSAPHPNEIFTQNEMTQLIEQSGNDRNKAIFSVLREALRPAEALRLNYEDLQFDGDGRAIIIIRSGKTGDGTVPTRRGFVHLKRWHEKHPLKQMGSPLFCNREGKRMSQSYFSRINMDLIEKLRLDSMRGKNLYNWRKSSITWFFRNGGSLRVAVKIFRTSPEMLSKTYDVVAENEISAETDRQAGIEPAQKIVIPKEMAIRCARCQNENEFNRTHCAVCNWSLQKDAKNYFDEQTQKVDEMQQTMKVLTELIKAKLDPFDQAIPDKRFKELLEKIEKSKV